MNDAERIADWEREEQRPITGWDFSYLKDRVVEEQPRNQYESRAATLMSQAHSALDVDTGGGEWLLNLRSHWPVKLCATEGYPPNLRLASDRLAPLGVQVFGVESNETATLPLADASFNLVLNRHGGYMNIPEIARVLTPGGVFLTQQVHGQTLIELITLFGATPQWPDAVPERYLPWIEQTGLEVVEFHEFSGALVFADVGAVVYYLHAIPWLVPHFSVATHSAPLRALQDRVDRGQPLRFVTRGYRIEARKPTS